MTVNNPLVPDVAEILQVIPETPIVKTFRIRFRDPKVQEQFRFRSGQFCMAGIPGFEAAPFVYASSPFNYEWFEITVKKVGRLTEKLMDLQEGNELLVRGPFGNYWPIERMKGEPIFAIAGGMGFPSIRSFLLELREQKDMCGTVSLFYGASNHDELVYEREISQYEDWCITSKGVRDSMESLLCEGVGYVVMLGPTIMMRNLCKDLVVKGFEADHIFLSNERMMKCGIGHCGHCNIGGVLVCRHGPIFSYKQILTKRFYEDPY